MKYYTEALINSRAKKGKAWKVFLLGDRHASSFYQARHRTRDIYLLWIESSRFGKIFCYPCVYQEDGEPLVFENGMVQVSKDQNARLVRKWTENVSPENIQTDYVVNEMRNNEFHDLFSSFRKDMIDQAIREAQAQQAAENGEAPALEDQPEAAPALEQHAADDAADAPAEKG